jgi:hypothetical protein
MERIGLGLLRGGAALLPFLALAAGCGGSSASKLMDGSSAQPSPAVLAHELPSATATRVVVHQFTVRLPSELARCIDSFRPSRPAPGTPIIERVGVSGRSVTFRIGTLRYACDAIPKPRFDADLVRLRPWCGFAVGKTRGGRLLDPRLSLCADAHGNTTAFAWIEPAAGARWIDVRDGKRHELYAVAASLPVRVAATSDVFPEESLALFHVTQYAADGSRLAQGNVEARVAG